MRNCPARGGLAGSLPVEAGQAARDLRAAVEQDLVLDWTWRREDPRVLRGDFTVENRSGHDVRDVQVTAVQFSAEGKALSRQTRTLFGVLKAGELRDYRSHEHGLRLSGDGVG